MAITIAAIRPALPSARMWSKGTGVPQTMQVAPRRLTVPSGGDPLPVATSNRTVLRFLSTTGSTQAFLSALVESRNERTSGICAPQAGFGHFTVRAHNHAITV